MAPVEILSGSSLCGHSSVTVPYDNIWVFDAIIGTFPSCLTEL